MKSHFSSSKKIFGRTLDLERLRTAVAQNEPLITLIGPPGVGKSALALTYAAEFAAEGAAAVYIVDAAGVRSPARLAREFARALRRPSAAPRAAVEEALAEAAAPSLVVFDNFESAVERSAHLLVRWLRHAPRVQMLVTSRERLRLRDETVIGLEPLGPGAERPDGGDEALRLFLELARQARPGFDPKGGEMATVRAIVKALEGLPLCIELAAGRLQFLSPEQLLGHLGRRLDALGRGRRDGRGRQRSLRAALDASWARLTRHERAALSQWSALEGGFSLEAAEAAVASAAFAEAPPAFELLHALVDKSLLRAEVPAEAGGARFAMLACVREYAAEKADRGAFAPVVVAREGRWFRCGPGEPVSLMKRGALRRVLWRLVEHRARSPGEALPLRALLEVGWPGQQMAYEAGNARVYNALTMLRNLGLRGVLTSRDDGYLLDPATEIAVAPGGDGARPGRSLARDGREFGDVLGVVADL